MALQDLGSYLEAISKIRVRLDKDYGSFVNIHTSQSVGVPCSEERTPRSMIPPLTF